MLGQYLWRRDVKLGRTYVTRDGDQVGEGTIEDRYDADCKTGVEHIELSEDKKDRGKV